ncbi:hypothetical protein Cgig2_025108 [Carnegiea gigantea]|uniref:Uncharacterized protein n=1 Tax=Carnegiea gigantea TaxID=171969 RepID=A0A9Q1QAA2_9CARY|nr:hypothetical protein Cgig2_033738 [Carnegiea gigantea]KAJ8444107.1 hypothetical protein Cgig2_025108 [Carnegiea gigantea]
MRLNRGMLRMIALLIMMMKVTYEILYEEEDKAIDANIEISKEEWDIDQPTKNVITDDGDGEHDNECEDFDYLDTLFHNGEEDEYREQRMKKRKTKMKKRGRGRPRKKPALADMVAAPRALRLRGGKGKEKEEEEKVKVAEEAGPYKLYSLFIDYTHFEVADKLN